MNQNDPPATSPNTDQQELVLGITDNEADDEGDLSIDDKDSILGIVDFDIDAEFEVRSPAAAGDVSSPSTPELLSSEAGVLPVDTYHVTQPQSISAREVDTDLLPMWPYPIPTYLLCCDSYLGLG